MVKPSQSMAMTRLSVFQEVIHSNLERRVERDLSCDLTGVLKERERTIVIMAIYL